MIHFAAKIERNDPCWCGSGKKYKNCHMRFDDKIKTFQLKGHITPDRSIIKTPEQIQGIKESAKVNMACLDAVAEKIRAGMSTEEIDRIVYETTVSMNAIPAPLHYEGFPKSVCTSINEEVCHGIPDEKHILKDGDIINVDCSTIYRGYFSDSSRMFMIGDVSEEKRKLVQVTKECVEIGLENVIPWTFLGDMGSKVHEHAVRNGYSVVREIGGHGCGIEFHEDPFVSYVSKPGEEMLMVPGMVFTLSLIHIYTLLHTEFEHGDMLPNVENIINPSMLLDNSRFKELLKTMNGQYRYVFVDAPPLGMVSDAERIGNLCDGAILCVRGGSTPRALVKEAIHQLERAGCPLLGIVLNRVNDSKSGYYHKYYGKYYAGE